MDTLDAAGELITAPEFESHLRHIDSCCQQQGAGPGLGSLTADNRDTWATVGANDAHIRSNSRIKVVCSYYEFTFLRPRLLLVLVKQNVPT